MKKSTKKRRARPLKQLHKKVKFLLLRFLQFPVGRRRPEPLPAGSIASVIVLAQEKIGDVLLLTPLLSALAQRKPSLEITVVAFSRTFSCFEAILPVSRVLYPRTRPWHYFTTIRHRTYDLLCNTKDHPSFSFLFHTLLIRSHCKAGLDHRGHQGYFDCLLPIPFYSHIALKNGAFASCAGARVPTRPYLFSFPRAPVRREVLDSIASWKSQKIIGLNLSAGECDRNFPVDLVPALCRRLCRPLVILAHGPQCRDKKNLESTCPHVIPTPVCRTIIEAGRIIHSLHLLISPDTAAVHIAAAGRIPVVGLYRADPVHHRRFYPLDTPAEMCISTTYRVADIPLEEIVGACECLLDRISPFHGRKPCARSVS